MIIIRPLVETLRPVNIFHSVFVIGLIFQKYIVFLRCAYRVSRIFSTCILSSILWSCFPWVIGAAISQCYASSIGGHRLFQARYLLPIYEEEEIKYIIVTLLEIYLLIIDPLHT